MVLGANVIGHKLLGMNYWALGIGHWALGERLLGMQVIWTRYLGRGVQGSFCLKHMFAGACVVLFEIDGSQIRNLTNA